MNAGPNANNCKGNIPAELIADKKRIFPHALGVALLPDDQTRQKILSVTDEAFRSVQAKDGMRLGAEKLPHVSVFQNMFRDPEEIAGLVERGLQKCALQSEYRIQSAPYDAFIWAESRPFISHEVTAELARFHDYLLVECIVNGRGTVCAGCPADHQPLQGLSKEHERAYWDTGYVFAGAGSELAQEAGVPWHSFTTPHFTLGVIDWNSCPAGESVKVTQERIVSQLRTMMKELHFDKCRFEKLVIFRVQPGGVYVPSPGNTVQEYAL